MWDGGVPELQFTRNVSMWARATCSSPSVLPRIDGRRDDANVSEAYFSAVRRAELHSVLNVKWVIAVYNIRVVSYATAVFISFREPVRHWCPEVWNRWNISLSARPKRGILHLEEKTFSRVSIPGSDSRGDNTWFTLPHGYVNRAEGTCPAKRKNLRAYNILW